MRRLNRALDIENSSACHVVLYTTIFKKVIIVNSRYWNREELWSSSSTNNLLLLASILQKYTENADSSPIATDGHTVTTFAGRLSLIMIVPKVPFGSSINYWLWQPFLK